MLEIQLKCMFIPSKYCIMTPFLQCVCVCRLKPNTYGNYLCYADTALSQASTLGGGRHYLSKERYCLSHTHTPHGYDCPAVFYNKLLVRNMSLYADRFYGICSIAAIATMV